MRIRGKDGSGVVIDAPAKVNLFLEVLGKRSDGFHELETVMLPVSLMDRLELCKRSDELVTLRVDLPNCDNTADPAWQIPADTTNLVVRAINKVREAYNIQQGCDAKLTKLIPSSAGLGGGSSNAAAAIVASMIMWDKWDRDVATTICAELGSDIVFFLGDQERIGLAVARGRGEICELLGIQPQLKILVTHPPQGCSTKEIFALWRDSAAKKSSQSLVNACKLGNASEIGPHLHNALEYYAAATCGWIATQRELLSEFGFNFPVMSGSGSSCFTLINHEIDMMKFRQLALLAGVTRAFNINSWYAPSIEKQIAN